MFERLHADPDGSTIATMLALAEGTLDERVATILPTLKVILLGGMQEPGHAAGSTLVGLLDVQAAAGGARRAPPSCGTRSRRACAGSRRSARRPAARSSRSSSGACRFRRARTSASRRVRLPRRGGVGADRRRVQPLPSATEPRRVRLRPALLRRPPLRPGAERIALRRLLERLPGISARPASGRRCSRLGVPRATAPPRPLGRMTWVDAASASLPDETVVGLTLAGTMVALARVEGRGTRSRPGARMPSARSPTDGSRGPRSAVRATARSSTSPPARRSRGRPRSPYGVLDPRRSRPGRGRAR